MPKLIGMHLPNCLEKYADSSHDNDNIKFMFAWGFF